MRGRRAGGSGLLGSRFGRFGAAASLLNAEGTGRREINIAEIVRDASGSGARSPPRALGCGWGETYKKWAKKKKKSKPTKQTDEPTGGLREAGAVWGDGGSWIPDFDLHGEPWQRSLALRGTGSR